MSAVEIVPATAREWQEAMMNLYGEAREAPVRIAALAGKLDGRVLGVGGIAFYANGARVAFCDVGDEGRRYKIALHKAALQTIALAKTWRIKRLLLTMHGMHEKTPKWAVRLGFSRVTVGNEQVYVLDL